MKTLIVVLCFGALVAAQQVPAVNARIVSRSAETDLPQAFDALLKQSADAAWVGYIVPAAIKTGAGAYGGNGAGEFCGAVKLEAPVAVMVLLRVQDHQVQRIRTVASDCQVDAGGLTLYWFDGVAPAQSVALLRSFVVKGGDRHIVSSALAAIAIHKDAVASDYLENLLR